MNDWIEWNGGECPVAPDVIVETRHRNGDENTADKGPPNDLLGAGPMRASFWHWKHDGEEDNIFAYRILSPGGAK